MRDLERERAADALAKVKALEGRQDSFKARYRSYADRLGGAVVMNGLGQALATELAASGAEGEDKEAHGQLAAGVSAWLTRPDGVYPSASDVMEAIVSSDQAHYLRAQSEALTWLTWHKKFCHASFPKGSDE